MVPASGAILDIEVDITWDDNTVWIGIISVEDYESLEKLGRTVKVKSFAMQESITLRAAHQPEIHHHSIGFQVEKTST